MEWVYPKRRGPEWKQGWTRSAMASISAPPLHLLMIFGIVISLLWLSQYKNYKAHLHNTAINFQLFLFLLPILLIFFMFMISYSTDGRLNFLLTCSEHDSLQRAGLSPWSIAILVLLLLVLLSYQSSFHSMWFGPL